jgi:hypothetical protein
MLLAGVSLLAGTLEATMVVGGPGGVHQLWPQALAPLRGPQSSVLRVTQEDGDALCMLVLSLGKSSFAWVTFTLLVCYQNLK